MTRWPRLTPRSRFVLVSAWDTAEAVQAARRAVALEPTNWRHFFRLGHASWGDERLRAAANTLALYPDFAFAHFQTAMVHVARGHSREAETVLRQGAAVQDRQIARGDRYPALGLHWMLGLVRLAQGDVDEALWWSSIGNSHSPIRIGCTAANTR